MTNTISLPNYQEGIMSVKMIIGSVQKTSDLRADSVKPDIKPTNNNLSLSNNLNSNNLTQQSVKLAQSPEAAIISLRAFRTSTSQEVIKDPEKASKVADKVANDIKNNKKLGLGAHDGVESGKSVPVLVN